MDMHNQEHYPDPTPQRALNAVEAQRKALRLPASRIYLFPVFRGNG